jgi:hypothetical protein
MNGTMTMMNKDKYFMKKRERGDMLSPLTPCPYLKGGVRGEP